MKRPRVCLIALSGALGARMDAYCRRIAGFALDIVTEPPAPRDPRYSAAVMPAEVADRVLTEPIQPAWPLIAYGPDSQLPNLFLAGCADYLRDPWTPEELELRVLRALGPATAATVFGDDGTLRLMGRTLTGPDGTVSLGAQEAEILRMLVANRGAVVTRDALFYAIWGRPPRRRSRAVDMHVTALRRHLVAVADRRDSARSPSTRLIVTVRGRGYRLD
ncbi:MAG: winged helix-turn-helix domain-containing protein [Spirochaetaceae bacterium]|nr:winged helix-turn-helix domain-containing protein [Spirochaetaceae bacterium]MDE0223135.1 winged helix-turn-helix domain-containing protein [Spirochaetaceae bacterium]